MRRRLDVAAALVQRPPVLFLDEPTTGLDIQSRTELWEVIRELVNEGSTVLLTTQYLEEADRLADRIAVLAGGRVVANDTAAALKARLERFGPVLANDFLLKCSLESYELTVFSDGRVIVKGTQDPAVARGLYARYIGA